MLIKYNVTKYIFEHQKSCIYSFFETNQMLKYTFRFKLGLANSYLT